MAHSMRCTLERGIGFRVRGLKAIAPSKRYTLQRERDPWSGRARERGRERERERERERKRERDVHEQGFRV
jgi:hypothetical protein